MTPIATIRQMLQDRVGQLVRELAPEGRAHGGIWEAKNPTRSDRTGGSFKVYLSGPKAGAFIDFAGVDAPMLAGGDKGDVIDLIAYCRTGRDRKKAIAWAKDWLGLSRLDDGERRRLETLAQAKKQEATRREAEQEAQRRRRALKLWIEARPIDPGAATVVSAYLAGRAIEIARVRNLDHGSIRFAPDLEWWKGRGPDARGVVMPGPRFPAIVCAIRDAAGDLTGVHCTFLAANGMGKAPVDAPKLMYGQVAGSVIRVSHGPSGLSPEDWRAEQDAVARRFPHPLIITEGLEDALTMAQACPEARVWAATSLGNLGRVPVDHPCVGPVFLCGDNDWGKGQAQLQFERAVLALEASGKPVSVLRSAVGKDFNDWARDVRPATGAG